MKTLRLALAAIAVALFSPALFADDPLVKDLERTRDRFLKSVEGLSEAQWKYKAAPDKWSIAECAEHIAVSEELIRSMIGKSLEAATPAEVMAEGVKKDEVITKFITDRSQKFKAPEMLQPSGKFATPAAAVEFFKKERAETIKLAGGNAADFRAHAAKHPAFGAVDSYGWFLIQSGHSERHTLQIDEVKASEGFPKE